MSLQARGNSDPGQLDRRVQLFSGVATRDAGGGESITWKQFAEVWAAKDPRDGRRMYAAEQKNNEAWCIFRIRHRSDVIPFQQLRRGEATYEIVHTPELGRGHYIDLNCRAVNQHTAAVNTRQAVPAV